MTKLALLFAVLVGMACSTRGSVVRTAARPPATRVEPVTDMLHGVPIVDNYRWLEGNNSDPKDPARMTSDVASWTDAQNAYTRDVLDHLPGRPELESRLRPLLEIDEVGPPAVRANRFFYSKRQGSAQQAVIYWRAPVDGPDHVAIDPLTIDPSGLTTVEWFSPSEDGKMLAYGTFRAGDENTTLHLLDVDRGQVLPLEIPNKTQAANWLPDGSGFVYQNLKNPKDPYSGQVLFHRMGTAPDRDLLLDRQFTKAENEKLATTWGPFGTLSRDGHWLVLGYWIDTKSNDLWLVNFDDVLKTGHVRKTPVSVGVDGQASGTVIDGTLYIQTTKGAPKGRVVAVDAAAPGMEHWRDVIPEQPNAVIDTVAFGKGLIAVSSMKNASSSVEVFDLHGRSLGTVSQPGIGAASVAAEEDRTDGFLTFESFNYQRTIFHVDLAHPAEAGTVWQQPHLPGDPTIAEVEQVWYPSKDGTRISMFLVHKKGLTRSGDTPTLLSGYGGFDISETPVFSPTALQWYEDGGLFALPNLRGGGEYGDAWHEAGMLANKQNVFDDFIAAAEWLIANKYTNAQKLAIVGGSNGGLLTGAALTQRPDLFRAALVLVPLLDMLRYQNFLMARYWVPEYGSAENPDQFRFLERYSPYQHVIPGTKYPAVLLTAGENDTRVHALHARKMAASLQAATTSDPSEQPVLLWVDRESGHTTAAKPINIRLRDVVDQRLFEMWQLGMLRP